MMAKRGSSFPSSSLFSHMPANAKSLPSLRVMRNGVFLPPGTSFHSNRRQHKSRLGVDQNGSCLSHSFSAGEHFLIDIKQFRLLRCVCEYVASRIAHIIGAQV